MANSIKLKQLDAYLENDQWHETQKLDGRRCLLEVKDGKVTAFGREGQIFSVDSTISRVFQGQSGHFAFDGELIGPVGLADLWIFDMPLAKGAVDLNTPYRERREFLEGILTETAHVHLLPVARTTEEKVKLAQRCIKNHAEGMILNRIDAPYIEGPRRSDYVLKAKLVETCDVVVTEVGRQGKSSVAVSLYENGKLIAGDGVGAVKVTDRMLQTLQVGDVIEVKYLYATDNRVLYQASFLRRRPDRTPETCLIDQLKIGCKQVLT